MNASLPPLPACSKQKSQFNKQTIYFLSASVSEKLAAHSRNRLFKYVIISEFTLCSHISRLLQHHSICMKEIEIRRGKGARGKKMFSFLSGLTTFSPYVHFPKVVDLSQLDFDPQHPQKIVRQSISKSSNDTTILRVHFL